MAYPRVCHRAHVVEKTPATAGTVKGQGRTAGSVPRDLDLGARDGGIGKDATLRVIKGAEAPATIEGGIRKARKTRNTRKTRRGRNH